MNLSIRSLLTLVLWTGWTSAFALVPNKENVELSSSEKAQLVHHACASRFGVSASEIKSWRWEDADAPQGIQANVTCQTSGSFRAMATGYRLRCERIVARWSCESPDFYILVPTDAGVAHVYPWKVSKQRAVDAVSAAARIDYMENEALGKIPIRDSLRNGADHVAVREGRSSDEVVVSFYEVQVGLSFRCKGAPCPRAVWSGRTYP